MLIDARSMPDGERIETDLCIVGCGAAGITVARELAAPGVTVTVLESGGPERRRETDALGAGESVGHPYVALDRSRARGIGGTSLHWQMDEFDDEGWVARPLDPLDFEARTAVPDSGWPVDAAALEPYYRRANVISQLGPFAYRPEDWPDEPGQPLPLDREEFVTVVAQRGAHTFGEYRDELASSTDVRVVHGATVLRLLTDDGGSRVTQADVASMDGRRFSVSARRFVLATGGLENARLLLLSGRPHERSGLGNEHDLVGRFFMERLSARAGVLLPAQPDLFARAGLYRSHLTAGMRIQGAFTLAPDVVRREGLRNAMFWIRQRSRATTAPGVGSLLTIYRMMRRRPFVPGAFPAHAVRVARDLPDVVRTLAHHGLRRPTADPEVFQVGIQAEQAPNRDSRITLGNRRDRFDQAVVRMDWRPTEADRDSVARSVELFDAGLRRANIGRMIHKIGNEVPQPMFIGNWHHMGTTRMNPDPARGVVDETCRVHSVSNLYVAGGSVFPTAGYANPTLTIVALAARLADELHASSWGDSPE